MSSVRFPVGDIDFDYQRRTAARARASVNRSLADDVRYLLRSLLFLAALVLPLLWFFEPIRRGFEASVVLNTVILGALAVGIFYTLLGLLSTLRDARAVGRTATLMERVREGSITQGEANEEILALSPGGIGPFLNKVHRVVRQGDAATLPYLLDSLATRAEDRRALVRFLTSGLILLGLIGTFFGVLQTLQGVREVLTGLTAQSGEAVDMLAVIQGRLAVPLGAMALAFSSSLFGLASSLVLAFLELQLFHAQNDVHADLESLVVSDLVPFWRPPAPAAPAPSPLLLAAAAGGTGVPEYVVSLLETTAERLDRIVGQIEAVATRDNRVDRVIEQAGALGDRIESLRATLEQVERERTAEMRHELRLLTRTLSRTYATDETPI